jgi:hypothetical protein
MGPMQAKGLALVEPEAEAPVEAGEEGRYRREDQQEGE